MALVRVPLVPRLSVYWRSMTDESPVNSESEAALQIGLLLELLGELGYRAEALPKFEGISSKANGLSFLIGCDDMSLEFSCGIQLAGKPVDSGKINKFNSEFRFGKFYSDDDGDIIVNADFLFNSNSAQDESLKSMKQIMDVWEGLLAQLKVFVNNGL